MTVGERGVDHLTVTQRSELAAACPLRQSSVCAYPGGKGGFRAAGTLEEKRSPKYAKRVKDRE
jgi:hypothetical protein